MEILRGDCLELMGGAEVPDLVLTDPPSKTPILGYSEVRSTIERGSPSRADIGDI
jgi:hypothetical protein